MFLGAARLYIFQLLLWSLPKVSAVSWGPGPIPPTPGPESSALTPPPLSLPQPFLQAGRVLCVQLGPSSRP